MGFDEYIRGVSIAAIVCAAFVYLANLAARACDASIFSFMYVIVLVPVQICAQVAPLVWRHAQARPIERQTVILAAWAVVITASEVALIVYGPDRGLGCFK